MKISVIMPARNAARFIAESIESVLLQDYARFELLICDDASEDETFAIAKRYAREPRVRLFKNRFRNGAAATRNSLIREAQGEYLSPCDADDILLPGNLRILAAQLSREPKVGLVYGDCLMFFLDAKGSMIAEPGFCGKSSDKFWYLAGDVVNHGGSLMRADLVRRVGGYDEQYRSVDDFSLVVKLAEVTRFKYIPGCTLYVWRRHPASMTHTDRGRKRDLLFLLRSASRAQVKFNER